MKTKALYILFLIMLTACNEYVPKPKGYARIDRGEVNLIEFADKDFVFLYPSDSQVNYVDTEAGTGTWFNISYPEYHAIIYCTYLPIDRKSLPKALEDSYQLAYSHAVRADGIEQSTYSDPSNRTFGIIYNIRGNVASPLQFYMTDSLSHFLRGSLYFDNVVRQDSVSPVVDFIRDDVVQLIESLRWKPAHTR